MSGQLVLSKGHTVHIKGLSIVWTIIGVEPGFALVCSPEHHISQCSLIFLRAGLKDGTITIERGES